MNFNEMNLRPEILKALEDMNFSAATEIQERAIVSGLEGKDLLAQAQTGTGKTAAFCLPILSQLDENGDDVQALMLAPTRELAVQITTEFKKMAKHMPWVHAISVYGGDPIDKQMKLLRDRPQVVIGTPGRVMDLINRKKLKLHNLRFFVLDEVDEMLNMGFIDDVIEVEKKMPRDKQTLFFSATMPHKIKKVSSDFLVDQEHIKVDAKSLTVDKVDQYYITCKDSRKYEALKNVLDAKQSKKTIIFTQTKRRADETFDFLISQNFKIEKIHGDLSQQQRLQTINRLRNGDVDIIVATDVVARGIDIDGIELVINLQLPQDIEYYIHRIGRTGRAGNRGESVTIVSHNEYKRHFQHYPKQLKCTITEMEMPKDDDIIQAQMEREYASISKTLIDGDVEQVFRDMANMFDEDDLREVLAIVFQANYPQLSKAKRKKIIKAQFEKTHGGRGEGNGNGRKQGRGNGKGRSDRGRDRKRGDGRRRNRKSNSSNSNGNRSNSRSENYKKRNKKNKTVPQS